jgi:hypothetical protein
MFQPPSRLAEAVVARDLGQADSSRIEVLIRLYPEVGPSTKAGVSIALRELVGVN